MDFLILHLKDFVTFLSLCILGEIGSLEFLGSFPNQPWLIFPLRIIELEQTIELMQSQPAASQMSETSYSESLL